MSNKGKSTNSQDEQYRLTAMLRYLELKDKAHNNVYDEFLTSNAILACQYGAKKQLLEKSSLKYTKIGNSEVLIDKDTNIRGTFGVCNSPRFAGLSAIKTIQVSATESLDGVAKPVTGHMCYMQLAKKWGALTKEIEVYDSRTNEYRQIPTTNSYILCYYGGGCIYPIDSGQRVTIGKEQWFSVLDEYLEGNCSDTEADNALIQIAGGKTLDIYVSVSNPGNRNYERYDNYIIGWTDYFNDRLNVNIDVAIIKAMLWKESKMGYANSSSPNANIAADVMQVLDPRNPTIYEYCTYNLDTTTNVKIVDSTGAYVLPVTIDPMYNHQKARTTYNTPVADRLFGLQSDGCYYYKYQAASPLLSIALGIKTYAIKLQATNGNALLAVQEYNGNPSYKVQYMNDVDMLAYNGGFGSADSYP